jgi:hypothetical protein
MNFHNLTRLHHRKTTSTQEKFRWSESLHSVEYASRQAMSVAGLKVRCLASTRISTRSCQEQELKEDEEQEQSKCSSDDMNLGNEGPDSADNERPTSSTSSAGQDTDAEPGSEKDSNKEKDTQYTSCIQEAQLSPDGTCIFTSDYNRSFSVYPIDVSAQADSSTRALKPYAQFTSSDPIWSFVPSPFFDINDPNSTHVLISRRDRYITLHNALWNVSQPSSTSATTQPIDISTPISSYKLINALTEAVTAPLSLAYSHTGTHFFAGARNSIHTFDLEYPDAPSHTISTIPSTRSKLKGGGRGFKGWISALTLSPPTTFAGGGMVAAGARTRHVGIYDATSGAEITTFSLPGTVDGKKLVNANMQHIIGDGVSSLKYSPCGKYLYVAERQSDVLLIYDVRNFSLSLGYCAGRAALTKQKLGFDVWNAGASPYDIEGTSHEIWAGGTDGVVRVWRDPYVKEGAVEPDEFVQIGSGDAPVVGTMVHPSGGLAVAACGVVGVGDERDTKGMGRGGANMPRYTEWGSVDVLQLM